MSERKKDLKENEIIKCTDQIAEYIGINPCSEDYRRVKKLVRQEKINEQFAVQIRKNLQDAWELGFTALPQILTLLCSVTPLGFAATASGLLLSVWAREQQKKCMEEMQEKVNQLSEFIKDKHRPFRLTLDEFMEYFVQAMDIVSKSASEEKRKALANLVVNSALAGDGLTGEGIAIRLISQVSNEEMRVLFGIHELEIENQNSKRDIGVKELANKLQVNPDKTNVICEGLMQLNLIIDPVIDGGKLGSKGERNGKPYHDFCTTELTKILLLWCAEEIPQ